MNSSALRVLAVILAIGAITVGYLGYQAGNQPKETAPVPDRAEPSGDAVILAAKEIAAGQAITEQDLSIGHVPTRPARAYASSPELIGKKPKVPIALGEMVLSSHFPAYSQLAQTVRNGERAVAVHVDETVGIGGFIEPGDKVDVLLFLRSDRSEVGEHSSAQVVLSNVRVLAFGNVLETPVEKTPEQSPQKFALLAKSDTSKPETKKADEEPSGKKSKTAVLAVPAPDMTKLMLADSSGKIRLALHGMDSEDEQTLLESDIRLATSGSMILSRTAKERKAENDFIELRDLLGRESPVIHRRKPLGPRTIIHKGGTTETVMLNRSHSPVNVTYSGKINR